MVIIKSSKQDLVCCDLFLCDYFHLGTYRPPEAGDSYRAHLVSKRVARELEVRQIYLAIFGVTPANSSALDIAGQDGWEAASIIPNEKGMSALLKRPR